MEAVAPATPIPSDNEGPIADRSACGRRWVLREAPQRLVEMLTSQEGLHPVLARVLIGRGITPENAALFLAPSLRALLPDPSTLAGMDEAVERLATAIISGETIGIFGDYDVDGTTSAALLTRYLRALGQEPLVHLPDRQTEGYGPNMEAFRQLAEGGARLIVTVDCGATAHACLTEAAAEGLEVIVLDHHLMERGLPPARAVVNPNRADCPSGLTHLSAGGVVFMTLVALNRALRQRGYFADRQEPNLLRWLDLVALSLVCDVMPLRDLTRVLVRQGLAVLQDFDGANTGNPGLRALAAAAGAKGRAQASHFGFAIGPRINAAGRIGHARLAFDLLTSDDPQRVERVAGQLQALNGERQGVEADVLADAITQAEAKGGRNLDSPLIVAGEGWHPGVIGIVAGRLKERFDRPAIVIAWEEGGIGKGSGRSLPGVDLGQAISAAVEAGCLSGGGGHPMAAGLSLTRDQLADFEAYLREHLAAPIRAARADQVTRYDAQLGLGEIARSLCDLLEQAGPFGNGHPEPRFVVGPVRLRGLRILKDKHIAVTLQDGFGRNARAIAFGCVGEPLGDFLMANADGPAIALLGRVKPDDFRGGNAAQFQIEDAGSLPA